MKSEKLGEIPEVWTDRAKEGIPGNAAKEANLDALRLVAGIVAELCVEKGVAGVFVGYMPGIGLSATALKTPFSCCATNGSTGMPCFSTDGLTEETYTPEMFNESMKMLEGIIKQLDRQREGFFELYAKGKFLSDMLTRKTEQ